MQLQFGSTYETFDGEVLTFGVPGTHPDMPNSVGLDHLGARRASGHVDVYSSDGKWRGTWSPGNGWVAVRKYAANVGEDIDREIPQHPAAMLGSTPPPAPPPPGGTIRYTGPPITMSGLLREYSGGIKWPWDQATPACNHHFVNVGFHHVKMVCKHCDQEEAS